MPSGLDPGVIALLGVGQCCGGDVDRREAELARDTHGRGARLQIRLLVAADDDRDIAPRPEAPPGLAELTAREHEIFRLIAEGLSNLEIGERLYISETTVKTHVTHILQKLDLRDRVQVVILAYELGVAGREARIDVRRPPTP